MTDVDFKLGLLIEPEELVPYLGHELIRVVDLSRASVYEQLHIPHAIHLQPFNVMMTSFVSALFWL